MPAPTRCTPAQATRAPTSPSPLSHRHSWSCAHQAASTQANRALGSTIPSSAHPPRPRSLPPAPTQAPRAAASARSQTLSPASRAPAPAPRAAPRSPPRPACRALGVAAVSCGGACSRFASSSRTPSSSSVVAARLQVGGLPCGRRLRVAGLRVDAGS